MLDFVDVIVPILEAGPWTNYRTENSKDPEIVARNKSGPSSGSIRGNKNARVVVKNEDGAPDSGELTFNGTIIYNSLNGSIEAVSTKKSDRNLMKTDITNIMKDSGLPFPYPRVGNNPSRRNKDMSTFFYQILDC